MSKEIKTIEDFEARDTLEVLYDFGLSVQEGLEKGLLIPSDVTPELLAQEEESKQFTSQFDSDPLFGIEGEELG